METLTKILQTIFDNYPVIKTECLHKIKSAKAYSFDFNTKQIVLDKYSFLLNDYEKRILWDFTKEQFNQAVKTLLKGDNECQ